MVWSPDGHEDRVQRLLREQRKIYVMNADGSSQTNLTNTPYSEGFTRLVARRVEDHLQRLRLRP